MGKKTNIQTIFQNNKINIWDIKYAEKKNSESSYIYSLI